MNVQVPGRDPLCIDRTRDEQRNGGREEVRGVRERERRKEEGEKKLRDK